MLKPYHLKSSDYVRQPWKNGRGETREIAIDTRKPFRWRLSWATVPSSGPFSLFPGYERILVAWKGLPLQLKVEGKPEKWVLPFTPCLFDGEGKAEATVSSAVEDFHLLIRKGKSRGAVYPTFFSRDEDMQFPLSGTEHFIFCAEGEIEIQEQNTQKTFVLKAEETFWVSRKTNKEYLNLRAKGLSDQAKCLWVVIHSK